MGGAREGPAWAVFNTQIARSGQSWQSLLFCSDGQQGMSPDIADMSVIAADGPLATAGVTTGATERPMVTKIASKSFWSRRRSIFNHLTGTTAWEARTQSQVRNPHRDLLTLTKFRCVFARRDPACYGQSVPYQLPAADPGRFTVSGRSTSLASPARHRQCRGSRRHCRTSS